MPKLLTGGVLCGVVGSQCAGWCVSEQHALCHASRPGLYLSLLPLWASGRVPGRRLRSQVVLLADSVTAHTEQSLGC